MLATSPMSLSDALLPNGSPRDLSCPLLFWALSMHAFRAIKPANAATYAAGGPAVAEQVVSVRLALVTRRPPPIPSRAELRVMTLPPPRTRQAGAAAPRSPARAGTVVLHKSVRTMMPP
jgi:hypothetical protein